MPPWARGMYDRSGVGLLSVVASGLPRPEWPVRQTYDPHTLSCTHVKHTSTGIGRGKTLINMMKYSVICALAAVGVTVAQVSAAPVSRDRAAEIAAGVLGRPNGVKALRAQRATDDNSAYYVFNAPGGGFAVIAADDRLPMVLAYSPDGEMETDDMPPAAAALLKAYEVSASGLNDGLGTHESWSQVSATTSTVIPTAKWGQGYPYNLSCPELNGKNCLTGCTATAMAILMKHHRWPSAGRGTGEYRWHDKDVTCDFSRPIAWDAMLDDYSEESSPAARQAVADLMYACGVSLQSNYGVYETSANSNSVPRDIYCNFMYDRGARTIVPAEHDEDEWLQQVRDEISAGFPLMFSGHSSSGMGHAFVIDGIDSDGLLHVNWGWEGASDGFYAFAGEAVDLGAVYGLDASMVADIRPGDDSSVEDIVIKDFVEGETLGLSIDVENIETGVPFRVNGPGVWNYGPEIERPRYIYALCDRDGNIKEVLETVESPYPAFHEGAVTVYPSTLTVNGPVAADDCLQLFISKGPDEPYRHVVAEGGLADRVPAKGNVVYRNPIHWEIQDGITVIPEQNSSPEYAVFGFPNGYNVMYPREQTVRHMYLDGQFYYSPWRIDKSYPDGDVPLRVSCPRKNGTVTVKLCSYTEAELKHPRIDVSLDASTRLRDMKFDRALDRITDLRITGEITGDDFKLLRTAFRNLRRLDLGGAVLCSEGSPDGILPYKALEWTCTLESIVLPESLRWISDNAFYVSGLKSVEFPEGLEGIGLNAFLGSERLEKVTAKNYTPLDISWCVFWGTPRETTGVLAVPIGYGARYAAAPEWSLFSRIVEEDIPVSSIESPDAVLPDEDVRVYSLDGVLRYAGRYSGLSLPSRGIYIVRTVGGKAFKAAY